MHPTYDMCPLPNVPYEILTHIFILIFGLADKTISVLLILFIGFFSINYFCYHYLYVSNNTSEEKWMCKRLKLKSYACAIHNISNSSVKYYFNWPKLLE